MMTNAHYYNVLEPKVTSSNCLFYPLDSLNPKDIKFTILYDKENHQLVTF